MYSRDELFLCSLECYFGVNFPRCEHQNNPLVIVETIRHSSTYIILYVSTSELWQSLTLTSKGDPNPYPAKLTKPVSITPLPLTNWSRVTHICSSKLTVIGSDDGLSPGGHQAIIWTKAGILLIGLLGTNFGEISIPIYTFSF